MNLTQKNLTLSILERSTPMISRINILFQKVERKIFRNKFQKGFTLIELMVVLVILGTLMGILIFNLSDSGINEKKARVQLIASKAHIEMGLFNFQQKFGRFPSSDEGLEALVEAPPGLDASLYPSKGFISKKHILDPWKKVYRYQILDDGNYDVYSLGADGAEGGEGVNSDIHLSDIE